MSGKESVVNESKIQLKDCGILLRHFALESINTEQEMYFCEIEDFEDLIDEGIMTKENWEEFEQDLKKFKLVEEGYLELHTDFENFEQDKDQIDCVMTGYMDFWKQFEYDQVINSRFPNKNFRKIIVEQLLDRHDGTTDIFKSDLEVLKKIEVLNLEKHKLTDIKGIEYFESLRKLDVSNNPIINLDVSDLIGLKELYAYACHIHNLKLPKSETLEILDVTLNNLESLDLENQSVLRELSCSENELDDLGVADCPCLETLYCNNNFISELDLSENKILKYVESENNHLECVTFYSLASICDLKLNGNPNVNVEEVKVIDPTIKFLTEEQVNELFYISKKFNITILCYGLRCDFQMKPFPGSARLLAIADSIEELKTMCKCKKRKATQNLRFINGLPTFEGDQVAIDGEDQITYESVCGECYINYYLEWKKNKEETLKRERKRK